MSTGLDHAFRFPATRRTPPQHPAIGRFFACTSEGRWFESKPEEAADKKEPADARHVRALDDSGSERVEAARLDAFLRRSATQIIVNGVYATE